MARPTKKEAAVIAQRNKRVKAMAKRKYPYGYIAYYFGITTGTVSKIVNEKSQKTKVEKS